MQSKSLIPMTTLAVYAACLFGATPLLAAQPAASVDKVDFTATPAPTSGDDLLKTYTNSVAKVTFADGNTADPEFVANTDNVFFSEKMRTLFIGEDSGMHQNNFVWAYNVDSKKLTRILTLAAGSEATGLQVVDNLNGHAYIMSNNQHQGDWIKSTPKELKAQMEKRAGELWGKNRYGVNNYRLESHVGYIGGLPAFKSKTPPFSTRDVR